MPSHRFLVTGAMGCLGAWTVRLLLDEGADVLAFDLSRADHRLRLLLSDDELRNLPIVQGDITDGEGFRRVVEHEGITHIVHLAALQVPLCKADPVRGARVNVEETLNVFEVARARADQVQGLSYASSVAVFGPPDLYPGGVAGDESPPAPGTLYGAYKLANEGSARVYAALRLPGQHGSGHVSMIPLRCEPSIRMCAPLTKLARSEARNTTRLATSSGVQIRPSGMLDTASS